MDDEFASFVASASPPPPDPSANAPIPFSAESSVTQSSNLVSEVSTDHSPKLETGSFDVPSASTSPHADVTFPSGESDPQTSDNAHEEPLRSSTPSPSCSTDPSVSPSHSPSPPLLPASTVSPDDYHASGGPVLLLQHSSYWQVAMVWILLNVRNHLLSIPHPPLPLMLWKHLRPHYPLILISSHHGRYLIPLPLIRTIDLLPHSLPRLRSSSSWQPRLFHTKVCCRAVPLLLTITDAVNVVTNDESETATEAAPQVIDHQHLSVDATDHASQNYLTHGESLEETDSEKNGDAVVVAKVHENNDLEVPESATASPIMPVVDEDIFESFSTPPSISVASKESSVFERDDLGEEKESVSMEEAENAENRCQTIDDPVQAFTDELTSQLPTLASIDGEAVAEMIQSTEGSDELSELFDEFPPFSHHSPDVQTPPSFSVEDNSEEGSQHLSDFGSVSPHPLLVSTNEDTVMSVDPRAASIVENADTDDGFASDVDLHDEDESEPVPIRSESSSHVDSSNDGNDDVDADVSDLDPSNHTWDSPSPFQGDARTIGQDVGDSSGQELESGGDSSFDDDAFSFPSGGESRKQPTRQDDFDDFEFDFPLSSGTPTPTPFEAVAPDLAVGVKKQVRDASDLVFDQMGEEEPRKDEGAGEVNHNDVDLSPQTAIETQPPATPLTTTTAETDVDGARLETSEASDDDFDFESSLPSHAHADATPSEGDEEDEFSDDAFDFHPSSAAGAASDGSGETKPDSHDEFDDEAFDFPSHPPPSVVDGTADHDDDFDFDFPSPSQASTVSPATITTSSRTVDDDDDDDDFGDFDAFSSPSPTTPSMSPDGNGNGSAAFGNDFDDFADFGDFSSAGMEGGGATDDVHDEFDDFDDFADFPPTSNGSAAPFSPSPPARAADSNYWLAAGNGDEDQIRASIKELLTASGFATSLPSIEARHSLTKHVDSSHR